MQHQISLNRAHPRGEPSIFQLQFIELIALSLALSGLPVDALRRKWVCGRPVSPRWLKQETPLESRLELNGERCGGPRLVPDQL